MGPSLCISNKLTGDADAAKTMDHTLSKDVQMLAKNPLSHMGLDSEAEF